MIDTSTKNDRNTENISLFFAAIWLLYLFLSPIYIFSKGMPQPADYLILLCGFPILIFSMMRHRGTMSKVFVFGLMFAGLTMTINLIHYGFIQNDRLLKHSIYYVFNFCCFLYALTIFKQNPALITKLTYIAVAASVIFQFIYAPIMGNIELGRNTGSFNNPNQLAYWCLLCMAIIIILKRNKPLTLLDYALFAMLLFLQSLALSKAGIIVTALMLPLIIFLPNMTQKARLFAIGGVLILLMGIALNPEQLDRRVNQIEQITAISERLGNIGSESDDSASGRGYNRLIENPEYLIFGAGEGAFFRFGIGEQEIHSGLATLLFSYGIVGFGFFILFLSAVFYKLPLQYIILLFLILLFGITHQNIRFTYFWVFLAIAHSHHFYFMQRQQKHDDEVEEEIEELEET